MRICRFKHPQGDTRPGCVNADGSVLDLTAIGITSLETLLESDEMPAKVLQLAESGLPRLNLSDVSLCAPVERQEIWAAGVTYRRSKSARMAESDFSATAYDRVYSAPRPELFFKALAEKVAAPDATVGIRRDARWSVPEPELALVLNSRGKLVGCTIGNDMSSRDIEGENLLYLPQAKIYERSCALGPWIELNVSEADAREWRIGIHIRRSSHSVFEGETSVGELQRSFKDLADYLFRCQRFPYGVVLLTGTGIIPPDNFTLQAGDTMEIEISGIGRLRNTVVEV